MKTNFLYKKITSLLALGAIGLAMPSCNKQLHDGPIGSTYGSEFWTSQASVQEAVNAMYGQLRSSLRASSGSGVDQGEPCYFVFGDLVSGVFRYAGGDTFLQYGLTGTATIPWNFSYVPYWGNLQDWSRFYQVIALCNLILQNVPQMPVGSFSSAAQEKDFLAQALFIRAYTYFYMTRVWGDPVYVSQTYNDADYGKIPPIPRSPEKAVLDSCIRDLHTASDNLDYAGGDPVKSLVANKGNAQTLMAHIFEWQHNYDSAHFYCQQVIEKGGYALEPMNNYKNIWKGQSSNESIFEIAMQYNANDPNFKNGGGFAEATFDFFGGYLKGAPVSQERTSCWIAPEGSLVDQVLFDTAKDLRAKSILSFQQASGGDPKGYMLTKYTNFVFQAPETKKNPYINNNLVLFRLADVYTLNAEALAYKGDLEGARENLAYTEDRAGITNYKTVGNQYDMVDEVVMERGREFIGEGQWFYDLIRTERTQGWLEYINYPTTRVNAINKGYYWPIDMATLFPYDNLLVQNTWWSNNSGH